MWGRNPYENFVGFLGDLKTPKGIFDINWPLGDHIGWDSSAQLIMEMKPWNFDQKHTTNSQIRNSQITDSQLTIHNFKIHIGAKYLVFVSSCSVKMRELSFAQFVYFLRKVCLFFNFLNDKFYNYVLFDIVVNHSKIEK